MKRYVLFWIFVGFACTLYAQKYQWAQKIYPVSQSTFKHGVDMCEDEKGNLYVLGEYEHTSTNGEVTFPAISPGKSSLYVAKYTPKGETEWIVPIGTNTYDFGGQIVCFNGSIYISARLQGPEITIGNKVLKKESGDILILQLSDKGAYLNHKYIRTRLNIRLLSVAHKSLYVGVENQLHVLSADLKTLDVLTFGSTSFAYAKNVVELPGNSVLVSGYFNQNFTYREQTYSIKGNSGNGYPVFILELDTDGNTQWVKTFGNLAEAAYTHTLVYAPRMDKIYMCGVFSGTINFLGKEIVPAQKGYHTVVAGLDRQGNLEFTRTISSISSSGDVLISQIFAAEKALFVTGSVINSRGIFYEGADTLGYSQHSQTFSTLHKLDFDGNLQWSHKAGGTAGTNAFVKGLAKENGNLYLLGWDASGVNAVYGCGQYHDKGASYLFHLTDEPPVYDPVMDVDIQQNDLELRLTGTIDSYTFFRWSVNGEPIDSTELQTRHEVSEYGEVEVCLYAENNCGSSQVCTTFNVIEYSEFPIIPALGFVGGDAYGANGSMSYTGGLVAYQSHATRNQGALQEGIQRPAEVIVHTRTQDAWIALKANMYPNPTQGELHVNFTGKMPQGARIEVRDVHGQLVLQKWIQNTPTSIHLNKYPSGIYLLTVYQEQSQLETFKIVKE